jgi:hypothetical protein
MGCELRSAGFPSWRSGVGFADASRSESPRPRHFFVRRHGLQRPPRAFLRPAYPFASLAHCAVFSASVGPRVYPNRQELVQAPQDLEGPPRPVCGADAPARQR